MTDMTKEIAELESRIDAVLAKMRQMRLEIVAGTAIYTAADFAAVKAEVISCLCEAFDSGESHRPEEN